VAVCARSGTENLLASRIISNEEHGGFFMATAVEYQMRRIIVALLVLLTGSSLAHDLQALKAVAIRYVAAMRVVLETGENSECSKTIKQASAYAAAKIAYYNAARQAMPALLQIAKGEDTDSSYGKEMREIFRGFGEDRDKEATSVLTNGFEYCPKSVQPD
jgi:hypothetical protein